MPRKIRFIPPGGALVEIGLRCLEARFLLRPSKRLNELLVGVLARAQRRTSMKIIAPVAMSNHLHLLVWAENAEQLSDFMEYAAGNAAREIGRLHDQHHRFWEQRYANILVTEEEAAQVGRLRYLLEQGCKEDLVESPRHWPGIHPARAILSSRPLKGVWINRTDHYNARRNKGKKPRLIDFEKEENLSLSPLPCWSHLSPEAYRQRVRDMVNEIEQETKERHARNSTRVAGRAAVLGMNPHHKPGRAKKRPAPLVHGGSKKARRKIREAYKEFVRAFRAAAEKLQESRPTHGFPEGAFPSALPFVRPQPILKPG